MKNNAKKSIKIGRINIPLNYWTGLAVYAVILLILVICMIVYTGSCLKKYENSQSDKVMNDFLNDFTKMAADKTLADNIELPASSEFEGTSGTGDRYKQSRYCSILRALKRTLKDVP